MARHKQIPPVARPTGKRRLLELGKDLLIAALTCSAVLLALQTPIFSQVQGWIREPAETVSTAEQPKAGAVAPYLVSVRGEMGLYGVSYDENAVGRAFDRVASLLGEGLATAGAAENITSRQFFALMDKLGIYCAFQGELPLEVLSDWLGGGGTLSGNVESLLLVWDGSQVCLAWQEGGSYHRAVTQVAYGGHFDTVLSEFSPNGAAYAYALARYDETYATLDPCVLVGMTAPQPLVYTAASPDLVNDRTALEQVLNSLGFQSGVDLAYESAGELAINESGDRLRLNAAGKVTFHAGEENRYGVACEGEEPTAAEAALAAWELLNRATAPWKGALEYVLSGVERDGDTWSIRFQARLGGVPVWTGESGEAARVTVRGRKVSDFTVTLRSCGGTDLTTVLPGERLAAAAMASLPEAGEKLRLCYNDNGQTELTAGWVAGD